MVNLIRTEKNTFYLVFNPENRASFSDFKCWNLKEAKEYIKTEQDKKYKDPDNQAYWNKHNRNLVIEKVKRTDEISHVMD